MPVRARHAVHCLAVVALCATTASADDDADSYRKRYGKPYESTLGVSVLVEHEDKIDDYVITVTKGDEKVEQSVAEDAGWVEIEAFDLAIALEMHRYFVAGELARSKGMLDPGDAADLVEDAARARGIDTGPLRREISENDGVVHVVMGQNGHGVVRALVGRYSHAILDFSADSRTTMSPEAPADDPPSLDRLATPPRRGAVTRTLQPDRATKVQGLRIELSGDTLTIRKGKREITATSDTGWFEVVAFGKLVQVRDGQKVSVAPARGVEKEPIDEVVAKLKLTNRGVGGEMVSARISGGVMACVLEGDGGRVTAMIGARSRDILGIEATPP